MWKLINVLYFASVIRDYPINHWTELFPPFSPYISYFKYLPLSVTKPSVLTSLHMLLTTDPMMGIPSWNLKFPHLLKNFPTFQEARRFITAFTRAIHWSLWWARLNLSIPRHPISPRSTLISYQLLLGLHIGLFPCCFSSRILYSILVSAMRTIFPAHFFLSFSLSL